MKKRFATLIAVLALIPHVLYAWDLELGVHRTKPRLGARSQTYQSDTGNLTYTPNVSDSILGQTITLGLSYDNLLVELSQADFGYKSNYQASDSTADVALEPEVNESRLGAFFKVERELAGFFIGGGISKFEETLTYQGNLYSQSGNQVYIKGGLVLVFGGLLVRADQVFSKLGEHLLQTTSVGVVARF